MRISRVARTTRADSLVIGRHTLCLQSADVTQTARVGADSVQTHLCVRTVYAVHTLQSHAFNLSITPSLRRTFTHGSMIGRIAFSIGSTGAGRFARILAGVIHTGGTERAIVVRQTVARSPASAFNRVTDQTLGTSTLVASGCILASGCFVARVVFALVHINALVIDIGVALETGAHASVTLHFAFSTAALEVITRIHTLVALHIAVLVFLAILIIQTLNLEASHIQIVRISQVARGTCASRYMIEHRADSVRTAQISGRRARIGALSFDADQTVAAVIVTDTLVRSHASRVDIGIAHRARFTRALVGAHVVYTESGAVARRFETFVHILAAGWCQFEAQGTLALFAHTHLTTIAVGIDSTARFTRTANTHLTNKAIAVSKADFDTQSLVATFTTGTITTSFAWLSANVLVANLSAWTLLFCETRYDNSDATFLWIGTALKARWTFANGCVV